MTSPASASTARRENATTTVPFVSERSVRGADELERQLALEDLQLALRERSVDERERVERAEQEDLAVLAREEQARPRRAALGVVRPLHLVEDEQLARLGRHLHRRADNRRALVHALLARDEPDVLGADPLAEAPVRLLREHPQRSRVDAGALVRPAPASAAYVFPEFVGPRWATTRSGSDAPRGKRDRDRARPRCTAEPAGGVRDRCGSAASRPGVGGAHRRRYPAARTVSLGGLRDAQEAAERETRAERADREPAHDEHRRRPRERHRAHVRVVLDVTEDLRDRDLAAQEEQHHRCERPGEPREHALEHERARGRTSSSRRRASSPRSRAAARRSRAGSCSR